MTDSPADRAGSINVGMLWKMCLAGLVLRSPISSASAVLKSISSSLALSGLELSALTTLPTLCLAIFAFTGSHLRARLDTGRLVTSCVAILALGATVRLFNVDGMFVGTVIISGCIAIMNVVFPGLIKDKFPYRFPLVIGIYTVCMAVGTSATSALVVPLSGVLHSPWRTPLFLVTVPLAALTAIIWVLPPRVMDSGERATRGNWAVWRNSLVWELTAFFGSQSVLAYFFLNWLPTLCADRGMDPQQSALMLSVVNMVQISGSLLVPAVIRRYRDQRLCAVSAALLNAGGLTGIALTGPHSPLIWVSAVVLGIGQGAAFTLGLTFIGLRSADADTATEISGIVQGFGYLIGCLGPLGAGLIHSQTGRWGLVVVYLLIFCGIQLAVGLSVGRDRVIASHLPTR
jgi:MFS transporter, CP family, cyanate transporter